MQNEGLASADDAQDRDGDDLSALDLILIRDTHNSCAYSRAFPDGAAHSIAGYGNSKCGELDTVQEDRERVRGVLVSDDIRDRSENDVSGLRQMHVSPHEFGGLHRLAVNDQAGCPSLIVVDNLSQNHLNPHSGREHGIVLFVNQFGEGLGITASQRRLVNRDVKAHTTDQRGVRADCKNVGRDERVFLGSD